MGVRGLKRIVFFFPLLVLFLWGCSRNPIAIDRYFVGESDHWMGLYRVVGSNIDHQSTSKLIYIGSDRDSVKKVKYSLKTVANGVSGEELLLQDREFIQHQSSGDGAVIPVNNSLEASVEWNDQIEKFSLNPSGPMPM